MKVAALSVITNPGAGLADGALSHRGDAGGGAKAYAKVEKLLLAFFAGLAAS